MTRRERTLTSAALAVLPIEMADNGSRTTVEEAATIAEKDLRAESDLDVTTPTARVKPTETRLPLHSEPRNPAKILTRIPVLTKFVHPRFKKPKADGESDAAKAAERNSAERTLTYHTSTHHHPPTLHNDIFPLIARTAAPREAAKLCRLSRLHAQLITKNDLSWAAAGLLWRERTALKQSRFKKAIKTMIRARTVGDDDIPALPWLYKRLYKRFPGVPVDCAARILEGLFVLGATINVEGSDGVLEDAIERGHEPVVRTLVKGGIDIHANDDQALCQASKRGRYDICGILITSGANVNAQRGLPLLHAVEFGYAAVCRLLIEAGARLKHDANDNRLVPKAAEKGQVDVVRTLLDLGGEVFTNKFFRALAVADCCGRKGAHFRGIVRRLEGSFEVSLEWEGALLRAAQNQDDCIVRTLLVNGAGRLSWVFSEQEFSRRFWDGQMKPLIQSMACLQTVCETIATPRVAQRVALLWGSVRREGNRVMRAEDEGDSELQESRRY